MELLNIYGKVKYDEVISRYELYTHHPRTNNFNNSDEIRIAIQHQDIFTHPNSSFIRIEGTVVYPTAAAGTVTAFELTTNAFAFLFDEIRFELNGVEVDKCRNVGITSTIKGYLSHTIKEKHFLELAGWAKSGELATYFSNEKKFYAEIPLRYLLGFAEDYKKLLVNVRQELILLRSRTDKNCYKGSKDVTFKIDKVEWVVPHVQLSDESRLELLNDIKSDKPILMPHRKWELHELPALKTSDRDVWSVKTSVNLEKPRYVIIALQEDRRDNEGAHASMFDNCSIRNMKIYLNSDSYPYENLNLNIERGDYTKLYRMYAEFQQSYFNSGVIEPMISFKDFKSFTLFVFDVSKQNESVKSSTVDLKVEMEAAKSFNANTTAYCLILCDSIVEYTPLSGVVRKLI